MMRRFVEEADRGQWTLLPECLDDFIDESNPVRVIDVFVDALDLAEMSFEGVEPAATGRPSYHPSVLLKLYIYGYLKPLEEAFDLKLFHLGGCPLAHFLLQQRGQDDAEATHHPAQSLRSARPTRVAPYSLAGRRAQRTQAVSVRDPFASLRRSSSPRPPAGAERHC